MKTRILQEGSPIEFATDINNNMFVTDALKLNYTDTKQSDEEFLIEEFQNFGNWKDVFGDISDETESSKQYTAKFKVNGSWDREQYTAKFKVNGSWDREYTEDNCEVLLYDIKEIS